MSVIAFNPDDWLESLWRSLSSYVMSYGYSGLDPDIYQIMMGYPSGNDIGQLLPFRKTLIHFEIDNITDSVIGFGDQIVADYIDPIYNTLTNYEANRHDLNLDVGIWASDESGGVTARLRAYKRLNDLFSGPGAYEALLTNVGAELISFTGAQFAKEEIDNIDVYRVFNMTLVLRVYSRKTYAQIPFVAGSSIGIFQQEELRTVDGILIPS